MSSGTAEALARRGSEALRFELTPVGLTAARRVALGTFLRHLARGERVAQRIAAQQAEFAPDSHAARFHRAQARQEAMHARLFDLAAARFDAPALDVRDCPYERYAGRLATAVDRRDYADTIVGAQVVLEALGDALLERLDAGIARHGGGFGAIRRLLRAQEAAHHAFGLARVEAYARSGERRSELRILARDYLALADAMIASGAPALEHFGVPANEIAQSMRARLPAWMIAEP